MTKVTPVRARKPRAFSQGKVDRILVEARALFTRHGYEVTSMDSVAAAAEVSKATVYAHFGSKSDLFAAVVADEITHVLTPELVLREAFAAALGRFGREALELILAPTNTAMFRMIAAESGRFPDLGRIFYDTGPVQLQQKLAAFLTDAMHRGELRREPADLAACQFMALICGDLQVREFLGAGGVVDAERERVLQSGIAAFLRAYAPDPDPAAPEA